MYLVSSLGHFRNFNLKKQELYFNKNCSAKAKYTDKVRVQETDKNIMVLEVYIPRVENGAFLHRRRISKKIGMRTFNHSVLMNVEKKS